MKESERFANSKSKRKRDTIDPSSTGKLIILLLLSSTLIFLAYWFVSIVRTEILTMSYAHKFAYEYRQLSWLHYNPYPVDRIRVIRHSMDTFEVYYTTRGSGWLLTFVLREYEWIMDSWSAVWVSSGRPNGFVWPYFRIWSIMPD